jgi:hypothetical protein
MSLGSPGIKGDRVWKGKVEGNLVGVLQGLAGQGFRKDAWVRMSQALMRSEQTASSSIDHRYPDAPSKGG